jgi:cold shock CspA family protein
VSASAGGASAVDAAHTGRVESFDEHRGTGIVITDSGEHFPFHCTAILDGTRAIEPGTDVRFEVAPGLGRWEAAALSRV